MLTNFRGIELIKKWEGLRLEPYKDPIGLWTIGYGHLIGPEAALEAFKEEHKLPLTPQRAEFLLYEDVVEHEGSMPELVKVPISMNMFAALSSFVFNLGGGALARSTLLKRLNDRAYFDAALEFSKWVRAGGRVLQGLVNRRKEEAQLFCTPDFFV